MKFKIRFADQIVGIFIILSHAILVFVTIMIGQSQRWFAKDISFTTVLPSASGLSRNMAVQYRGFTIGSVSNYLLNENDEVEVTFVIHEEFSGRARLGSMVEIVISPIGLGSQFLFHSGNGQPLNEGDFVPVLGSPQAMIFVNMGLAEEPRQDDSISAIMNRVNAILEDVNLISALFSEALGEGNTDTEIGKIMGSVVQLMAGLEDIGSEITPILADIGGLTSALNEPDGLLYTALDTEGDVYLNLVQSLSSVSGILDNLDRTTAFIPGQLPQIAGLIFELRATLVAAEDVLIALTNNPLLRGGVPERLEVQSRDTSPRNIRF